MDSGAEVSSGRRGGALPAIIVGGLTAGLFDISYAIGISALHGVAPMTILQSVASGLLGKAAYAGGAATAALGGALHFVMMLIIAAIFVGVRRWLPLVRRQNPWLLGPLYGVWVYFVMNRIVMPLSNVPMKKPYVDITFTSLAAHMVLIGLVIALAAARFDPDGAGRTAP